MYERWLCDLHGDDPWEAALCWEIGTEYSNTFWDFLETDPPRAFDALRTAVDLFRKTTRAQRANEDPRLYTTLAYAAMDSMAIVENGGSTDTAILDTAVQFALESVACTPPGYPQELQVAADAHVLRFRIVRRETDLSTAIRTVREALRDISHAVSIRHCLADFWVDFVEEFELETMLEACNARLDTLAMLIADRIYTHPLDSVRDYIETLWGIEFLPKATQYSLSRGLVDQTLNILSRGRGLIWTQLLYLQERPLTSLAHVSAGQCQQMEMIIEATRSERKLDTFILADEILKTAKDARGFTKREYLPVSNARERPLRLTDDLQRLLSSDGHRIGYPLVILNAAVTRCDALILRGRSSSVQQLSMTSCPRSVLDALAEQLQELLGEDGPQSRSTRHTVKHRPPASASDKGATDTFMQILEGTWRHVVWPALQELLLTASARPTRLWWYPTPILSAFSSFLCTLQAYTRVWNAFARRISSYLPAFSVPESPTCTRQLDVRAEIVAICQTRTEGFPDLPDVGPEVEAVREAALTSSYGFTAVKENLATVATVSAAIQSVNIVHFALHVRQDPRRPLESSLMLADGDLKISALVEMILPKAELVFLSACETATGDLGVPEESIHLAAAMLYFGFKGAIGTMWRIADCDGPPVAETTYRHLLSGDSFEPGNAAYAIHQATTELRRRGVHPIRWAPFIHLDVREKIQCSLWKEREQVLAH